MKKFVAVDQEITTAYASPYDEPPPGPLAALFERWCRSKTTPVGPAQDAFDVRAMEAEVADWSVVVDVHRKPLRFVFSHWGRDRARLQGRDYTGEELSALRPASVARKVRMEYLRVAASRTPVIVSNQVVMPDGARHDYYSLRLPLVDASGDIGAIVATTHYPDGDAWVAAYFGAR